MTGAVLMAFGSGGIRATVSPSFASGFGTGTVSTGVVSVSVVGGATPYSYSWSRVSGDSGILPFNPGAASTAFYRDGVVADDTFTADYICTVTDANGVTGETDAITISITGI